MVFISGEMEEDLKVIGLIIICMGVDYILGRMVVVIKDNI